MMRARQIQPGMIFRPSPAMFPVKRAPRWLQATEVVTEGYLGHTFIAYMYATDDSEAGVASSGRWFPEEWTFEVKG